MSFLSYGSSGQVPSRHMPENLATRKNSGSARRSVDGTFSTSTNQWACNIAPVTHDDLQVKHFKESMGHLVPCMPYYS